MTKNKDIKAETLKIPKAILLTAKFLEIISPKLVTLFAAKLFTMPIKHKIPKREWHMDEKSKQQKLFIPAINKEIIVYEYGETNRKIVLIHGWSGRGTQLVKIADELLKIGFSTVSFDAPAHGKSKGTSTLMPEFITSILELEKQFGPFEYAIGHSLGGMSLLNDNLSLKKAIIIGSGDIIQDITDEFVKTLKLNPKMASRLTQHFEKKYQISMDSFSASVVAKEVKVPVLIIHDNDDSDVTVKAAHNIHKNLNQSELLITNGLGHRKILGDNNVIKNIVEFITK